MRILLDHCIDWRLKRSLAKHDVKTAQEMGWDALQNGKLLEAAAPLFDAILTVDQNIKHQQNMSHLPIAVVVLVASSNRLSGLQKLLPAVENSFQLLKPGVLIEIDTLQQVTVITPGRS